VELVKNLPVAAGIGGGSADAAATLRGYLRFAGIGKTGDEISAAALALGADVPVCLAGRACRMRGMGERLTPLQDFKPLHAVLVNPMIEVQTSAVFGKLELAKGEGHGASLAGLRDATGWRNDLTAPALALAPAIAVVIQAVENREGLRFARMSGSGPTCFGVFENPDAAREAARAISASHPQWWVRRATLS
ncbi:MAG: 4-(cytidine 5'-diphospho)-2-C-methyl-D-erythritol kinase, partial [Aestuariivirga sp.]